MGHIIGKVGLSPQGKYEPTRTYVRLMTVSYNGSYWVAVKDVPANAVPYDGSVYWHIMVGGGNVINAPTTTYLAAGITSQRPSSLGADQAGMCFFDKTINKPIWWNGNVWVDATGTSM